MKGLARCYQETMNYRLAVRCFKKLLEAAWDSGDTESEIHAYQGLSQQYFYLCDLKRSKYYQDRAERGKLEKKDSKIRAMYMGRLNFKKQFIEKYNVKFGQFNNLERLMEEANMQGMAPKSSKLNTSTILTIKYAAKNMRQRNRGSRSSYSSGVSKSQTYQPTSTGMVKLPANHQ